MKKKNLINYVGFFGDYRGSILMLPVLLLGGTASGMFFEVSSSSSAIQLPGMQNNSHQNVHQNAHEWVFVDVSQQRVESNDAAAVGGGATQVGEASTFYFVDSAQELERPNSAASVREGEARETSLEEWDSLDGESADPVGGCFLHGAAAASSNERALDDCVWDSDDEAGEGAPVEGAARESVSRESSSPESSSQGDVVDEAGEGTPVEGVTRESVSPESASPESSSQGDVVDEAGEGAAVEGAARESISRESSSQGDVVQAVSGSPTAEPRRIAASFEENQIYVNSRGRLMRGRYISGGSAEVWTLFSVSGAIEVIGDDGSVRFLPKKALHKILAKGGYVMMYQNPASK